MKEKDFKIVYEIFYNKYVDKYIDEVEELYKRSNEEGDAEIFAYNSCCKLLTKKRKNLKINSLPFINLYSIFRKRSSLVQNNNLNRLYIKHIQPECKKIKIEIGHDLFIDLLSEFAISEASTRVYSWFSNWSTVYGMMYKLDDFSEFEIIRNCNYFEGSEIFKKYHKRLYPPSDISNTIPDINFEIKIKFKDRLIKLYNDLKSDFIDDRLTSEKNFIDVLTKSSNKHESKIYFSNFDYFSAYILREIEFAFEELNFTNIGKSKLIFKKNIKPFSQTDLSHGIEKFNKNSILRNYSNFIKLENKINKIIDELKKNKE